MVWVWAFFGWGLCLVFACMGIPLVLLEFGLFTCRLVVEKGRVGGSVARFVACIGYRHAGRLVEMYGTVGNRKQHMFVLLGVYYVLLFHLLPPCCNKRKHCATLS